MESSRSRKLRYADSAGWAKRKTIISKNTMMTKHKRIDTDTRHNVTRQGVPHRNGYTQNETSDEQTKTKEIPNDVQLEENEQNGQMRAWRAVTRVEEVPGLYTT